MANAIFRNKTSVNNYEAQNNCKVSIFAHKTKQGIFLFSHSQDPNQPAEGLVSKRAIQHLQQGGSKEQLQIADCDYIQDDGTPATCKMLMLAAGSNCGALMFTL